MRVPLQLLLVLPLSLAARPKASDWKAGQSIFWPKYIAEGTVYTRSVADMPVLPNSKEIAAYMNLSPRTITNAIQVIYQKLGISSKRELGQFMLA